MMSKNTENSGQIAVFSVSNSYVFFDGNFMPLAALLRRRLRVASRLWWLTCVCGCEIEATANP